MPNSEEIVCKIKEAFPNADVQARDLTGGGDHWQLSIKSDQFNDKNLIEQHQLVYRQLGEWLKQEIHALTLDTSGK